MYNKSEGSKKSFYASRLKQSNYKLIFREAQQKCLDCEQERRKFVSHHVPREVKKQAEPGRNSFSDNKPSSSVRKQDCQAHNKENSMLAKLKEIEKISNRLQKRPLKKKVSQFRRSTLNNESKPQPKTQISQTFTYENLKKIKKKFNQSQNNKQHRSIFIPSLHENLAQEQLSIITKQKPNQLFNFMEGFPNYCLEDQFGHPGEDGFTNLYTFARKLKKSEIMTKVCDTLKRKGSFDLKKGTQLRPNFISVARTLEFAQKNGFHSEQLKNIMKETNCIL